MIKKPLGLVLAEGGSSGSRHVFVEEIVPGGNAEKNGMVRVGDVLAKTSAVMLKSGKDGSMSQGHGEGVWRACRVMETPYVNAKFQNNNCFNTFLVPSVLPGDRLYDNWETVEFDCSGQDFSTVMAAIGSNNERWGIKTVTLTLRRDAA